MSYNSKFPFSAATDRILALANQFKSPTEDSETTTMTDYKFEGWVGLDKESANGKMVWQEFTPKTWTENDVDIKVTHCGICGSDIHTLRSGWVRRLPSLNTSEN